MGGTHGRVGRIHVAGSSIVHRLAPEAKLVGVVALAAAMAWTPRRAVWAFAVDAALVLAVVTVARLPVRVVMARLVVVVPFLLMAAVLPFVASGPRRDVLGVGVSAEGLWGAWNIAIKAVLGATAAIVFGATTPVTDVLRGLTRVRVPAVIVSIVAFMVRYLDVLADELARTRIAMTSRGHDPRWLWQARPLASSLGALFVRSYERGERVHHAMLARGFTGAMPVLDERRAAPREWTAALAPGLVAGVVAVVAVLA